VLFLLTSTGERILLPAMAICLFNPLKPSGNYMYRPLEQEVALHFFMHGLHMTFSLNNDYFLKQR
jgi:hypothetical protein